MKSRLIRFLAFAVLFFATLAEASAGCQFYWSAPGGVILGEQYTVTVGVYVTPDNVGDTGYVLYLFEDNIYVKNETGTMNQYYSMWAKFTHSQPATHTYHAFIQGYNGQYYENFNYVEVSANSAPTGVISAPSTVPPNQPFTVRFDVEDRDMNLRDFGIRHQGYGQIAYKVATNSFQDSVTATPTAASAPGTIMYFRGEVNDRYMASFTGEWVPVRVVAPTTFRWAGGSKSFVYQAGVTRTITKSDVSPSPSTATFDLSGTLSQTDAGTYGLTATATGDYEGSAPLNWTIERAPVTFSWTIAADGKSVEVTSNPVDATCTRSGTWSASAAGTYSATITATGNYTGGDTLQWTVAGAPPDVSASISVSPTAAIAPGSATVTWSSVSATSVVVSGPGLSSTSGSGSHAVSGLPAGTHTYTITAQGNGGPVTRSATIAVADASLSLSPSSSSTAPASTTISWSATNTSSVTLTGPNVPANTTIQTPQSPASGTLAVTNLPASATPHVFQIVAQSAAGVITRAASFQVSQTGGGGGFPWGAISGDADPGTPSASGIVGSLSGDLSVDNKGAANYFLALRLPSGRGGMEPRLGLSYSSNAGNGPLGVGFSVATGFPQAITRGRSILARDGQVRGVNFDADDKFYLDGKRLICVSGVYGSPGSSYRTEVDTFVTIAATGSGSNIETFTLTDKSGVKMIFGKHGGALDGYQKAAGPAETLAYAYALKHVEDAVGNSIDFDYKEVVNTAGYRLGEYVLGEIRYTGSPALAKVKFLYNFVQVGGSTERLDRSVSYIAGRAFALSRRLDGIDVEFDGARFAYYRLGYECAPRSGRSRLTEVQTYLRNPSAEGFATVPSTRFAWTDEALTTSPVVAQTQLPAPDPVFRTRQYTFADFTGDGKSDYLSATSAFTMYVSNGAGFAPGTSWYSAQQQPWERKVITGDFNGDGKQDIVYGDANFYKLYALKSTGSGFVGLNGGSTPTLVADTTQIFKDPGTIVQTQEGRQREGAGLTSRITVGDFNGDGMDDILLHAFDGYVHFVKSTGAGFLPPQKSTYKGDGWEAYSEFTWTLTWSGNVYPPADYTLQPMPCDLNGDGMTDYAAVVTVRSLQSSPVSYGISRSLEARISLGNGDFSKPMQLAYMGGGGSASNYIDWVRLICAVMPLDVNGDGLTDFMVLWDNWADAGNIQLSKIDRRRWTLYLNKGVPAGASNPGFATILGPIPNTITRSGESFNTFYSAFTGLYDSTLLDPSAWIDVPDLNRRRAAVESSGGSGMLFTDMNADGFPDLVWFANSKPGSYAGNPNPIYSPVSSANAGWWVLYSTGGGPDASGAYFANPTRLTAPGRTPASIWETAYASPTPGSSQMSFSESVLSNNVDLNGDGRSDWVVHWALNGEPQRLDGVALASVPFEDPSNPIPFGDLVETVTDGLGKVADVGYRAAKDDVIYTPGAPVSYPVREIRSSQPVVSDVWHDMGGTGGNADRAHFTYQYSGNRMDLAGRGSLGFHSFITLDAQTDLLKYQFLAQSFPMTGLAQREQTYRYWPDGANAAFRLISSHDNTVVFDRVSSYTTVYPFVSRATESRWEDSTTAGLTTSIGAASSQSESLFGSYAQIKATQGTPHITISSESLFDNQTAIQTTLPATGYNPTDIGSSGVNTVTGTTSFDGVLAAFTSPTYGKITRGNLEKLTTDFGGGYSETVDSEYYPTTSNGLSGLVKSVATTVTAPAPYSSEAAPLRSYTYWSKDGVTPTPLIETETVDGGTNLTTTTTYMRAARGQVEKIQITGSNLLQFGQPSTTLTTYEASNFDTRFDLPQTEKNALGHQTTTRYGILAKPTSVTDANGAETTTSYDALGRLAQTRDVLRNLQTDTAYTPDTSLSLAPPAGVVGLTVSSKFRVDTTTTVKPKVSVYHDRLGRPIRMERDNFRGATITDTIHNKLGQVVAVSNQYPAGQSAASIPWTTTLYDRLGRVRVVTAPNGTETDTQYKGRATIVTVDAPNLGGVDPAPQVNSTIVDAKGRTLRVWNADNVPSFSDTLGTTSTSPSIAFVLDGFGRMRETLLRGQSQKITAEYDKLGRQTALNDPDKGPWSYVNSPLGHVLQQTDARGTVTRTDFDALGRPLTRTTTEPSTGGAVETAQWFYYDSSDNSATHTVAKGSMGWIGALQRATTSTTNAPGYAAANSTTTNAHYYDSKGRPAIDLTTIDGKWFYTYTDYQEPDGSDYSRVTQVRHAWRPAGREAPSDMPYIWRDFAYRNTYDARSYLLAVTDSRDRTWWKADPTGGYDHLDRPVLFQKGSAHWTHRTYRPTDGVLTAIKTGPTAGSGTIQNLSFTYDGLGNLTQRTGNGQTEVLGYDELNRLTSSSKQGAIQYFDNGNIRNKTGIGGETTADYAYETGKPHAVGTAFGYEMTYDPNGNLLTRSKGSESWSLAYAGFDKPRWMAKDGAGSEFLYDANRSRTMHLEFTEMSGGAPSQYLRKRIYAGGPTLEVNYENPVSTGSPVWKMKNVRTYVPGPDGVIGAREFEPMLRADGTEDLTGGTETALIYHYDHLGSIDSITDFGSVGADYATGDSGKSGQFSEDAWGQRRNPLTWTGALISTDNGGPDSLTPRGFTGHEMLDDLGLVHMNGRIYDPLLGRFLSADVVVQFPGSLQSYNRYSYVQNNPLTFTDPTGWFTEAAYGAKLARYGAAGQLVLDKVEAKVKAGWTFKKYDGTELTSQKGNSAAGVTNRDSNTIYLVNTLWEEDAIDSTVHEVEHSDQNEPTTVGEFIGNEEDAYFATEAFKELTGRAGQIRDEFTEKVRNPITTRNEQRLSRNKIRNWVRAEYVGKLKYKGAPAKDTDPAGTAKYGDNDFKNVQKVDVTAIRKAFDKKKAELAKKEAERAAKEAERKAAKEAAERAKQERKKKRENDR